MVVTLSVFPTHFSVKINEILKHDLMKTDPLSMTFWSKSHNCLVE